MARKSSAQLVRSIYIYIYTYILKFHIDQIVIIQPSFAITYDSFADIIFIKSWSRNLRFTVWITLKDFNQLWKRKQFCKKRNKIFWFSTRSKRYVKSNQYYNIVSIEWMRLAKLEMSYSQTRRLFDVTSRKSSSRSFSTDLKLVSSLHTASGILYMSGPRDLEETPRVIWNIAVVFRLEPSTYGTSRDDPYRAWTRPFGPARAERTNVITRGDNRCLVKEREGGKRSPARIQ